MNNSANNTIKRIIKTIGMLNKRAKVKFAILYGSYGKEEYNPYLSDIDLAVYYEGDLRERFYFRTELQAELGDKFDVQVFQDLPLNIQASVIRTGKIVYCQDEALLYQFCLKIIKEFEDFKKYLDLYYQELGGKEVA